MAQGQINEPLEQTLEFGDFSRHCQSPVISLCHSPFLSTPNLLFLLQAPVTLPAWLVLRADQKSLRVNALTTEDSPQLVTQGSWWVNTLAASPLCSQSSTLR